MITAITARQIIPAAVADQGVGAAPTNEDVAALISHEQVIAVAADDALDPADAVALTCLTDRTICARVDANGPRALLVAEPIPSGPARRFVLAAADESVGPWSRLANGTITVAVSKTVGSGTADEHVPATAAVEIIRFMAKYATKSTEQAGSVCHPITEAAVDHLPVREHVRAFLRAAFELGADPALAGRRFAVCAHALGHRGHCVTKSRGYSTTFTALREAREQHVHEQLLARIKDPAQRASAAAVERVTSLRYVGQGHVTAADAFLAASAAARAREQRQLAREALAMSVATQTTTKGRTDGDSGCRG